MNKVKKVIYNQVLVDELQLSHIKAFLKMALKHRKRTPKRKFRIIIEELEMITKFSPP